MLFSQIGKHNMFLKVRKHTEIIELEKEEKYTKQKSTLGRKVHLIEKYT